MKKLTQLGPAHKAACRMRIEGRTNDYICEQLEIAPRTLHVWMSDDLVKGYLHQMAMNVETEFAVQLARSGMIAIAELETLVQEDTIDHRVVNGDVIEVPRTPTVSEKLQAINALLNRLPSTATNEDRAARIAAENSGGGSDGDTTNVLNVISGLDNRELAGVVQGSLAKMLTGGGDSPS